MIVFSVLMTLAAIVGVIVALVCYRRRRQMTSEKVKKGVPLENDEDNLELRSIEQRRLPPYNSYEAIAQRADDDEYEKVDKDDNLEFDIYEVVE